MRRLPLLLLVAVVCLSPAWASDQGEPIDCADFVFVEPGLSCSVYVPWPIVYPDDRYDWWIKGDETATDNTGGILIVKDRVSGNLDARIEILRHRDGVEETMGFVESRLWTLPGGAQMRDLILANGGDVWEGGDEALFTFDPLHGRLYLPLNSRCNGAECPGAAYGGGKWIAVIEGFTTTFEVLQTYEPSVNEISFLRGRLGPQTGPSERLWVG